jgi:hypothetical protein
MVWRTGVILAFIVAAAVLAYQIGSRLSDEAIMTIVGVLCGIGASIPVSIGLLLALTRERSTYADDREADVISDVAPAPYNVYRPDSPPHQVPPQVPQMPQIIVVAPPQQPLPPNGLPYGNYLPPQTNAALPPPMQERTFKIVGEEDEE